VRTPPPRVFIASEALAAVLAAHQAAVAGPKEPCGLALGNFDGGNIRVGDVRVLDNVHANPDRAFLLPATGAVAAVREGREKGLAVVGVWHGHLRGSSRLSESDAAGLASASRGAGSEGKAAEVPYVFLVSGAGAGRGRVVRAFVHHRGKPREVRLDVQHPSKGKPKARAKAKAKPET
jgi:proteasome lid subunit RPN8/RPN11